MAAAALLTVMVGVASPVTASYAVAADGTTGASSTTSTSDEETADESADEERATKRQDADRAATRREGRAADGHSDDGTAGTSGDADEEQPLSTADENDGGANGDCPEGEYCSTRDGSASENGAGDGEATGKPCAGCVGKADNKNPNGQLPDAESDGNRGYECDDNQGVGQGNPAHTGCVADADDDSADGTGEVAGEEAGVDGSEVEVAGVEAFAARPGTGKAVEVKGAAAVGPLAAILPATGSGAMVGLAGLAGVLLLVAGTTLLRRRARA